MRLIDLELPACTVNTCAMGHCLITLYQVFEDEIYGYHPFICGLSLRHDALRFETMCCSIPYPPRMIFRSSAGPIRCLWRRFPASHRCDDGDQTLIDDALRPMLLAYPVFTG